MRTFTTQHTVYNFDELTDEAKQKALENHRQFEYETLDTWLEDDMDYKLGELLKENNIKSLKTDIRYSLGYSQGDGASFTGDIEYNDTWRATIGNNSYGYHYSHWNTVCIEEMTSLKTDEEAPAETEDKLLDIIHDINKELKRYGYARIDDATSDEQIIESIEANEYEFYEDGRLA